MRAFRPILLAALLPIPLALSSSCYFFSPTGLDGIVEALLRADCHFAFACCTPPERDEFFSRSFRDEGTCVAEGLEQGNGLNVVVDRAKAVIAAGNGEFQQDRADECVKPLLDARNNCDAEAVLAPPPGDVVCSAEFARGFVVGKIEDGDDCNDDIECANFGRCDRSDNEPGTITTAGECKEAKPEGDACVDGDGNQLDCFPGTFCFPNADGDPECQEVELLGDGEDCFADGQCESGFCEEREVFACFTSGEPCTFDTEAVDCPDLGDFCDEEFQDVCAEKDVTVEVCDGT